MPVFVAEIAGSFLSFDCTLVPGVATVSVLYVRVVVAPRVCLETYMPCSSGEDDEELGYAVW